MKWLGGIGLAVWWVAALQGERIGAALFDGARLVYDADGVEQPPWHYDSVRVVARESFERCVAVFRTSPPERIYCVRGDTLFQTTATGALLPARPIGPRMSLEVATAAGGLAEYRTGAPGRRRVAGLDGEVGVIATTILTRDATGRTIQRLTEEYAPALLTALGGVFEAPDSATGEWRRLRTFTLKAVWRGDSGGRPPPH